MLKFSENKEAITIETDGNFTLVEALQMALKQLKGYRKTTRHPKELEWEIRLYEWILTKHNAEELAREYMQARKCSTGVPIPKREAVKALGWVIP